MVTANSFKLFNVFFVITDLWSACTCASTLATYCHSLPVLYFKALTRYLVIKRLNILCHVLKRSDFYLQKKVSNGLTESCAYSPESFALNYDSGIKQHANLISESVCNDSDLACHNVGHAATQVSCTVCVLLCSHYINQSPKHLPDHRSSCRRDLRIHNNTCRLKILNSENSEEDRGRSESLLWTVSCLRLF